jgi:hypothetical protein
MATMYVRGEIPLKPQTVPLEDLKLDPDNVRFKHLERRLTDAEMEELVWKEQDTRELMRGIRASGGLMEPPLVDNEGYIREGNRRVVCLRKLKALAHEGKVPEWPKEQFDKVDCALLPPNVSSTDIAIYLARVHVKGKKHWARLNQARHIYDLYNDLGQSYEAIREYLGMGKSTVQQMNRAYTATMNFLQRYPERAEVTDFVFFDHLYRRRPLREWVLKNEAANLAKFQEWVVNDKIKDPSRELKYLPLVLTNEPALEALEAYDMEKAKEVLEKGLPALTSPTFEALQRAIDALRLMPLEEYRMLRKIGARR